ncbi:MAG TPA: biotin-dependent carboxyltransferase family protein, partial [bacterium]|nr:biotin-dependent carboxyltransferase family protein [bacterium]
FAVERAGLYSTIQDGGRIGHRALGVPPSGAMDPLALWAANAAAGNPPDAPALELTAPGPVLRALDDLTVAVAGADLSAAVDGSPVEPATPLRVRRGQRLAFGAPRAGVWAYIAVAGGVEGHRALGSAATFAPGLLGGSGGRRLREGDIVGRGDLPGRPPRLLRPPALPASSIAVRVILGPQDEWLTEEARAAFLKEEYRTSRHGDRAGLRLDGPRLAHREARAFLSDGVLPGAVQVPPDGAPIVLLADGPTTGGYPKIAVVIAADLRLLAQARPGTAVRFRAVAMEEAVDAWRALIGAREGG